MSSDNNNEGALPAIVVVVFGALCWVLLSFGFDWPATLGIIFGGAFLIWFFIGFIGELLTADDRKRAERNKLIEKHETEAKKLLSTLEAQNTTPSPTHDDESNELEQIERERLEKKLASQLATQENLRLTDHKHAAKALVETQRIIEEIRSQLDGLLQSKMQTADSGPKPLVGDVLLDEAIARCPRNAKLYAQRACYFLKHDCLDNDEALADAEKALQIIPGYAHALTTRGVVRHRKGDLVEAEQDFLAAIKSTPKICSARTSLAALYIDQKKYRAAIQFAKRALDLGGNILHAHWQLARAQEKLGNQTEAIEHYTAIIDRDSDWTFELLPRRAKLLYAKGNHELALRDLKRSVANRFFTDYELLSKLEPDDPTHYLNISYDEKNCRKAIEAMREKYKRGQLTLHEANEVMEFFIEYIPQDNFDEAVAGYREAIKIAESMGDANLLAYVLYEAARFSEIRQKFDYVLSFDYKLLPIVKTLREVTLPRSGNIIFGDRNPATETYFHISLCLGELGKCAKSIEVCLEGAEHHDDHDNKLLHFGLAGIDELHKKGESDQAIELLKRATEQYADHRDESVRDVVHGWLAEIHATWRDLFDLDEARVHAKEAWSLSDRDTLRAATWWAICEAIEEGLGQQELEPHYPDPLEYREIERLGREEQQRLGLIDT